MLIDLHTHSSASDGSFSPEELIDYAIEKGISILALCDHDTTDGINQFIAYGANKDINTIPGLEISATWDKGNCHIIGLGIKDDYQPLESILQQIRDSRDNRNIRIIEKLNSLGINITIEQVENLAGGNVVARPHIARVMHNSRYVSSVQEAFDNYLAKGAPAYVDRFRLEPGKAVQLLCDAGSTVVLAHPSQLQIPIEELDKLIGKLKPYGLSGIEIYSPYTSDENIPLYIRIAEKQDLFVTGGSDFHGESKPNHFLGYYRKDKPIPESCAIAVR